MAQSINPLRRSIFSKSQNLLKFLQIQSQIQNPISKSSNFQSFQPSRNYASVQNKIIKPVFENNLQRLLRNQLDLLSPVQQPPSEVNGFKVEECPGEQKITLSKQYGEYEKISGEVMLFNYSVPILKEGEEEDPVHSRVTLHMTMRITIFKGESSQYLELICHALPEVLDINKIRVRDQSEIRNEETYDGPELVILSRKLQDSLYAFLEERGIDDNLCAFLHKYGLYKSKAEFIRWAELVGKVL